MAAGVPPPPLNSPSGSYYWLEWYTNLTNFLNGTNIPWSNLNFNNSDIADIHNRNHNELTSIQGGNASGTTPGAGNAWHMTGKGTVSSVGAGTGLPTGWTVGHPSTGNYTITHNLGIAFPQLGATATSNTTGVIVQWIDCSNVNLITVHLVTLGGVATDANFTFTIST